jgi:hypothetical protein
MIGGNGADVLVGGIGDTLTGGNGPDTFLFRPDFGANTITNFDVRNDVIQLDKSIFSSVADLLSHTSDTANGAVISDTHGDTIRLRSCKRTQVIFTSSNWLCLYIDGVADISAAPSALSFRQTSYYASRCLKWGRFGRAYPSDKGRLSRVKRK